MFEKQKGKKYARIYSTKIWELGNVDKLMKKCI